jgi:hypothetical protein
MPRFVILEHDHPRLHWDLMLEVGSVLKTWRLAKAPETPGEMIEAVSIGDHRIFYLDYEGPVSGERGNVKRWDAGTYETLGMDMVPPFKVRLAGQRVQSLAAIEPRAGGCVFWIGRKEEG